MMKLFFSPFSPYVRKVRLAAIHVGLHDRIELVDASLTPIADDPAVSASNPLGKIPTLLLEDGTALYDSRVIVEYLDATGSARLIPAEPSDERWRTLRLQAIADGLLDAALLMRYENACRPDDRQWPVWVEGQYRKIVRALDALEGEHDAIGNGAPLNGIVTGCALGYLDLRFPGREWRAAHPALADFFAAYGRRPAMVQTAPPSV